MDPNAQGPLDPARSAVDISKILLPKKEGPSPASAQRVNAGVLLEQEQAAAAENEPNSTQQKVLGSPVSQSRPGRDSLGPDHFAEQSPAPSSEPAIKQLETYQGDIESVVEKKNVSVVSIAAAEAERRSKEIASSPASEGSTSHSILYAALGVVLIATAAGVLSYLYLRPTTVPVAEQAQAPFISVDSTQVAILDPSDTPQEAMDTLESAKDGVNISLGLVAQLLVVEASSTGESMALDAQDFLSIVAPDVPPELLRTLSPQYLLGVHSYDENDAFLILQTDDYNTAYAGMLAWEPTLMQDLSPLFVRHPSPTLTPVQSPAAASTATTTSSAMASTTSASSTPVDVVAPNLPQFVDQVVDNQDARVLLDSQGNIILLWTFVNPQTIVITNNDATLREIISRFATPALQSLPQ